MRHVDAFADADFTWEKYDNAYSNELANDLGNLVQRLATMCKKNSIKQQVVAKSLDQEYQDLLMNYESSKAFDYAWNKVQSLNKRIDETKPWELAKNGETERLGEVMSELVQGIILAVYHLEPFLPDTSDKIEKIFSGDGEITPPETPLFPKN